jgi:hypothetical protein
MAPGSKIVVAGRVDAQIGTDFGIARYERDGTLDSSFGDGGKVMTDFAGLRNDDAKSVARAIGGRILVGGFTQGDANPQGAAFAISRYVTNGSHQDDRSMAR